MRGTTQIDSLTVTHQEVSGAIAQLGERLPCTQEVGGSIPPGSTNSHHRFDENRLDENTSHIERKILEEALASSFAL